ncbi:head-to-tail adaptor [Gordonia phage Widow]|nr:head-to-tail adaptor [Gordonia phage Widow]
MSYPPHGLTPAALGLDSSIPNVEKAVDRAVAFARREAGWHIFPEVTETLTLDGEGGSVLTLPSLHVTELLAVTENGSALDEAAYEWSATGDLKRRGRCWTTRWRGVTVELKHGYDLESADLADLLGAIAGAVGVQAANPLGIPEVIGPYQLTGDMSQAWIGDGRTTLSRFCLPWSA